MSNEQLDEILKSMMEIRYSLTTTWCALLVLVGLTCAGVLR